MLDNNAPYFTLIYSELCCITTTLQLPHLARFEPVPQKCAHYDRWQYGIGQHASELRPVFDSTVLPATVDGKQLLIEHLVLDGFIQRVIDRNLTLRANGIQLDGNYIKILDSHRLRLKIPLIEHDCHRYLPKHMFAADFSMALLNGLSASTSTSSHLSWPEIKTVNDLFQSHVCVDSNLRERETFLERSALWINNANKYLDQTVFQCKPCFQRPNHSHQERYHYHL